MHKYNLRSGNKPDTNTVLEEAEDPFVDFVKKTIQTGEIHPVDRVLSIEEDAHVRRWVARLIGRSPNKNMDLNSTGVPFDHDEVPASSAVSVEKELARLVKYDGK